MGMVKEMITRIIVISMNREAKVVSVSSSEREEFIFCGRKVGIAPLLGITVLDDCKSICLRILRAGDFVLYDEKFWKP